MKTARFLLLTISVIVGGCAWVKPTPEGDTVRVVSAADSSCQRVGETTVSERTKFGPYQRNLKNVKTDLLNLARNSAADTFAADTIVPLTAIKNGRQTFAAYKCLAGSPSASAS